MDNRSDELARFKSEINLSEYAASCGYMLDRSESSKNSVVMRKDGDKIIIARALSQHYIYFSRRSDTDNGTIIDFIQNRTGNNLGQIRKELRPWIGGQARKPSAITYYQKNITITKQDREKVIHNYSTFKKFDSLPYLKGRGIPDDVVADHRFKGRIFRDRRRNAIFPHFDENGLCGYEIKNKNYTGFASGGIKTVWVSQCFKQDAALVFTESAIESLSHFTLYRNPSHRYVSVGGSWSEDAEKFILKLVDTFKGKTIILAFNNDEAGHDMAKKMRSAIGNNRTHRHDILEIYPAEKGMDWNNVLRERN